MLTIQTEEIKQFVKKVNPTEKHNQALRAHLGKVIPSTSKRIGERTRIYHQVSIIKFPLDIHQCQDVYI